MQLFAETALFDPGKRYERSFDLPGAHMRLWEQFFAKDESDRFYLSLLASTTWTQHYRKMYDNVVADPRLTAWFGKPGTNEWTPDLLEIKERVESACEIRFDCVLLNYYRDGNDSVAWHSDTLPASGTRHAIGSVSFGETRVFKVRHKTDRNIHYDIPLTHGSFLLMGETMQDHYEHHIPKTARKIGARLNLTFRKI